MFKFFNFKFNITAIKIILLLLIITFFLPFFSVSCGSSDPGTNFSGLEISTGKNIRGTWYNGNILGFILIIPPVILFILSFYIYKIKKANVYNIVKTIFFIAPVFDIFAAFIIKYAFKAAVLKAIYEKSAESGNNFISRGIAEIARITQFHVKSGFVFYIILNAAFFMFAVMNYFIKRE